MTALSNSAANGHPLTDDEILLNCDGMLSGGLETTPLAVAGALVAIADNPDCWQQLRGRPELFDSAAEEILRWTSPAAHVMRTAVVDISLGEAQIRSGDRIVVWLPSANRDEAVFPDHGFVIGRNPNPHLSFGGGPHSCVGAVLARLELRCLLRVLARLVFSIDVTGREVRRHSNFLHGHEIAGSNHADRDSSMTSKPVTFVLVLADERRRRRRHSPRRPRVRRHSPSSAAAERDPRRPPWTWRGAAMASRAIPYSTTLTSERPAERGHASAFPMCEGGHQHPVPATLCIKAQTSVAVSRLKTPTRKPTSTANCRSGKLGSLLGSEFVLDEFAVDGHA
ncbi:Linalool 8-monooxygenase [Mycobacterium innocens]|uniref:Linalool 8-monooxygenase n=1 Tax=Mycobacterium innocens TaxID=2341083 RepID=A0A498QJE6_9MYCO|nr:Linalool 8-monooxygenase [Mycobacterium innocens]